MDWNINVEEVAKVLKATQDAAQPFERIAQMYTGGMNSILRASGSNFVNTALGDFARHYEMHLTDMATQTVASLTGAAEATKAYQQAQYEMALNAQRRAPDAPARQRQEEARQHARDNAGDRLLPQMN